MNRGVVVGAGLAVCAALGCQSSSTDVTLRSFAVAVNGVVNSAAGSAVPNANVQVHVLDISGNGTEKRGRCTGASVASLTRTGQAGNDGRFSLTLAGNGLPFLACAFVDATGTVGGASVSGVAEADSIVIGPTGINSLSVVISTRP